MAGSSVAVSEPGDLLEMEVRERWQKEFGEPLPITGGLELAISILSELEDKATGEAERPDKV